MERLRAVSRSDCIGALLVRVAPPLVLYGKHVLTIFAGKVVLVWVLTGRRGELLLECVCKHVDALTCLGELLSSLVQRLQSLFDKHGRLAGSTDHRLILLGDWDIIAGIAVYLVASIRLDCLGRILLEKWRVCIRIEGGVRVCVLVGFRCFVAGFVFLEVELLLRAEWAFIFQLLVQDLVGRSRLLVQKRLCSLFGFRVDDHLLIDLVNELNLSSLLFWQGQKLLGTLLWVARRLLVIKPVWWLFLQRWYDLLLFNLGLLLHWIGSG